jgi:phospholipid/cholesterol/gamma-HCH transport system substrate-binding protein
MPKRSNDFVVGLVTVAGVVAIVLATLWAKQADVGRRRAQAVARFQNVGGAQPGNGVFIRGVRAGRIEALELADGGWVQVRMSLDPEVHLPPDPVVVLAASSLFGDWQAAVMTRAAVPDNPAVREQLAAAAAARGADDALPGATLPDIAQLTAVAGRIAGDVASVAERVQTAFTDTAAVELRSSIANVAALSAQLRTTAGKQSANLDVLAREVTATARALNGAAQAMQRTVARADSSRWRRSSCARPASSCARWRGSSAAARARSSGSSRRATASPRRSTRGRAPPGCS